MLRTQTLDLATSGEHPQSKLGKAKGIKKLIILVYQAGLLSCLVPYSFNTPLGFLSTIDLVLAAFFGCSILYAITRSNLIHLNVPILSLSLFTLVLIVTSQIYTGHAYNISPVIKYSVFLFVIPLSMTLSGIETKSLAANANLPAVVSIGGSLLALASTIQILRHEYATNDGVFYIEFFGNLLQKNWLGCMLTFGTIAATWEWVVNRQRLHAVAALFQLFIIAFIGARSSTLVAIAASSLIFLFMDPRGHKDFYRRLFIFAAVLVLAALLLSSGLLDSQIARIANISTDTSDVTASSSRIILWRYAIDHIRKHPFLGYGYSTFFYQSDDWMNGIAEPHNNVLQIAYAGGLIGLATFFIFLIFALMKRSDEPLGTFLRLASAAYICNTFVDIIWTRGDGHLFWLLLFANALSIRKVKRNSRTSLGAVGASASPPLRPMRSLQQINPSSRKF
jgi:O-antigen ligase